MLHIQVMGGAVKKQRLHVMTASIYRNCGFILELALATNTLGCFGVSSDCGAESFVVVVSRSTSSNGDTKDR